MTTLKQIKPSDLVVGQEVYVKMKLHKIHDNVVAFCYTDDSDQVWLPKDQPIFTLESEPSSDRLKMVVEVASRWWDTKPYPSWSHCIKDAKDFITACENAIKEVSND